MGKQQTEKLEEFRKWIIDRVDSKSTQFKIPQEQRNKKYAQLDELRKKMMQKQKQILDKFQEQKLKMQLQDKNSTTTTTNTVFVTFRFSRARGLITKLNKQNFRDKLREFCGSVSDTRIKIKGIKISRAPEPGDIYWTNIGVPVSTLYKKKIITFTVTVIMLGISFGIIYGLSLLQVQNKKSQIISFGISIVITIINVIIGSKYFYLLSGFTNFNCI